MTDNWAMVQLAIKIGTSANNTNWVRVATGDRHSLAINEDGQLYAWGYNNLGQLGDGKNIYKTTPALVKIQVKEGNRKVMFAPQ